MFALNSLLLCLCFFLTGCGFRPLYQADRGPVSAKLQTVKISTIENREGQILHNHLSQMFGTHHQERGQKYLLQTTLTFKKQPLAISKSASTVQESISLDLKYTLSYLESGQKIFAARETLSIDETVSAQSPYSNWISEKTAQERLVYEAAETIRTAVTAALEGLEHP